MESGIPVEWPSDWEGSTLADIGGGQKMLCSIILADGYTTMHQRNYSGIIERWGVLWPAACGVIQNMLVEYEQSQQIHAIGNSLLITIPMESIDKGAEWSIALKMSNGDGVWDASFEGWIIQPDESQPYF